MDDDRTNKEESNRAINPPIGIFIISPPVKTTYLVGEYFDPSGMVVKANYADGTNQVLTFYSYSPSGPLTTSNTIITISYLGKTATQPIMVYPLPYLFIDHLPNKTTYITGDEFEPYGMVVKLYSGGTIQTITNYSISPSSPLTTGDNHVTVSYNGYSAEVPIIVDNPPSTGYFPNAYLGNAIAGDNPIINLMNLSTLYCATMIIEFLLFLSICLLF